jgi:outer membrane protein OmpA-like peptidoglycan-associated protein
LTQSHAFEPGKASRARRIPLLIGLALASHGCATLAPAAPERPGQDLVALLPDGDGAVGAASVGNGAGRVDLAAAREATTVAAGQAPAAPIVLTQSDVDRIFGEALAAQPPAPRRFFLYFRFESEDLTDGSLALVQEVLRVAREFPLPRVTVVGHTDTTGAAALNVQLGQRRADSVRALLIDTGLDPSAIDATSHGESAPIVPTGDNVVEPMNRRVEVTVR